MAGQAANWQLGKVRPTAVPSGQIFASCVQAAPVPAGDGFAVCVTMRMKPTASMIAPAMRSEATKAIKSFRDKLFS
jgi:hypothetical protein